MNWPVPCCMLRAVLARLILVPEIIQLKLPEVSPQSIKQEYLKSTLRPNLLLLLLEHFGNSSTEISIVKLLCSSFSEEKKKKTGPRFLKSLGKVSKWRAPYVSNIIWWNANISLLWHSTLRSQLPTIICQEAVEAGSPFKNTFHP